MTTAALFAVCALLVFSPFFLEIVRFVSRGLRSLASRRSAPAPLPDYGSTFESSVQDALYGNEPRWQRLEVKAAEPGAGRPVPPYVVGRPETGAPLRSVSAEAERADRHGEPDRREAPEHGGEVQAA